MSFMQIKTKRNEAYFNQPSASNLDRNNKTIWHLRTQAFEENQIPLNVQHEDTHGQCSRQIDSWKQDSWRDLRLVWCCNSSRLFYKQRSLLLLLQNYIKQMVRMQWQLCPVDFWGSSLELRSLPALLLEESLHTKGEGQRDRKGC